MGAYTRNAQLKEKMHTLGDLLLGKAQIFDKEKVIIEMNKKEGEESVKTIQRFRESLEIEKYDLNREGEFLVAENKKMIDKMHSEYKSLESLAKEHYQEF